MKLEIQGRLRQASFCSVEMYSSDDDDEGFVNDQGRSRKEALSVLSEHSLESSKAENVNQRLLPKKGNKLKIIGNNLRKGTRTFGTSVIEFFRFRGLLKRLRRIQLRDRYQSQENLV